MSVDVKPRRVLVAARPPEAPELAAVFTHAALKGWQMLPAGTLEQARSLAQQQRCEALVVDECLYERAAPAAFGWLCRQRDLPVVLLSANEPETLALAYGAGVSLCLPRRQTLKHPPLLAAALHRTAQWSDECRAGLRTVETLSQCRRQVDRLVSLLLRPVPTEAARQWLTQRQILERLQEEVCRSGRHGNVLSVAVGEVQAADADPDELADWTARSVAVAKRRCDIAGHYGLHGRRPRLLPALAAAPGRILSPARRPARAGPRVLWRVELRGGRRHRAQSLAPRREEPRRGQRGRWRRDCRRRGGRSEKRPATVAGRRHTRNVPRLRAHCGSRLPSARCRFTHAHLLPDFALASAARSW